LKRTLRFNVEIGNGETNGDPPPCLSHIVVNDPLHNIATLGIHSTCGNGSLFNTSIGSRWIRFVDTDDTTIPLRSPGVNH